MKKNGILNSEITKVLADLGHTDTIVIADCGLPIPPSVKKVDLALAFGNPSFLDILNLLKDEMVIEKVTIATEMEEKNKMLYKEITESFPAIEKVSHEEFKEKTKQAMAIIRTGEATPYANIILHAGVLF
ncbi:D-ribose pyranase [Caldifermentibacillus hisashii]|uniref:D-ribose pyranase n=1 Tax=Caldifermentibacillus hisashii TaxID=996558 RepID=UPI000BA42928|nr:D-ribose pyranase [Caldifermentibacillus hisashii]MEC5273481.1 D-ribose pyranase [Caldifermentibacillus hisashii]PAC35725.1 D-ribose pyranase [Caldifermentibacillus hisashii]